MPSWAALAAKPAAPGALIAPAVADEEKAAALNGAAASASETAPAPAAVEEAKPVLSAEDAALLLAKKVVLDSGAIIKGGRLEGLGQKFWTIKEVLAEVRDSKSRAVLDTLAVELEVREVDPAALAVVANFSKLTGDYQRLSAVDLKVMALTYQIEKQFHGTSHLHSRPRPATATQKTAPDRHTSAATSAETESAARHDCLDSHASALSCEGQEEEEEIDPSEFERAPMAEGEWKGGAADRDDTASVAGSEAGSKVGARTKKKSGVSSLPGWGEWEDGKDDEAGWITKDNLVASTRLDQVEERKEDDTHVACATLDGAMQNVLLQMGLKVVDTDGYVVKNVKQFVLKCHACFAICHDTSKQFCPSCGNATMMRVSMWVQADGRVTYSKGIKNFSIRGTKYSLPLPVQGRNKDDVVLREDQLAMSRHRQRRDKVVLDDDGFQTLVPRDERKGRTNFSNQEVISMGYAGGGKNNPNARKRH